MRQPEKTQHAPACARLASAMKRAVAGSYEEGRLACPADCRRCSCVIGLAEAEALLVADDKFAFSLEDAEAVSLLTQRLLDHSDLSRAHPDLSTSLPATRGGGTHVNNQRCSSLAVPHT